MYNSKDQIIQETLAYKKNHIVYTLKTNYDKKGNIIEVIEFGTEDELISKEKIKYLSFDNHGNWTKLILQRDSVSNPIRAEIKYY